MYRPFAIAYTTLLGIIALVSLLMGGVAPQDAWASTQPPATVEPLPPGATVQTVLSNLNSPVAMAFDPQGRLFYTELTGAVRLYANGALQPSPVITFTGGYEAKDEGCIDRRLLGITVDPSFNANHYIYVYLTDPLSCEVAENKVIRFSETNGVGSNPTVIFSSPQTAGIHQGGNIYFGPDGKLYISIGDDNNAANAQDVTVKPGKMHRINPDGSIPADNPVFTQTGALPSLYAMGLRNSFDFTFDTVGGTRLFLNENGPECDDELNRAVGGYNYGWRLNYPCDDANPDPTYNSIPPLWYTGQGEPSAAPTGIEVYTGTSIPAWQNGLFMCSYNDGVLRHFYLNGDRTQVTSVADVQGVTCNMDLETGPDGALYYIEGGGYPSGNLKRIMVPATPTATPSLTPVVCNVVSGKVVSSPNWPDRQRLQGIDAISSDDVWAVGCHSNCYNSTQRALIEHWDGRSWNFSNISFAANLTAVEAISATDVWAVGSTLTNTLTVHWDGTQWRQVPSPNVGQESGLKGVAAVSTNDIWAVGYSRTGSAVASLILHWDGVQWSTVQAPEPQDFYLNAVTVVAANDVWAVGSSGYEYSSQARARSLHWDGTQWNIVPLPATPYWWRVTVLHAVDAVSSNDVWAVGAAGVDDGTACIGTYILHWDGTQWNIVGGLNGICGGLYGMVALAANDIWAVGYRQQSTGLPYLLTEHWDGAAWSVVPSAKPSARTASHYAVTASSGSDVWAAGESLEHWDGTGWNNVPPATYENHLRGISVLNSNFAWAVGNSVTDDGTSKALIESTSGGPWGGNTLDIVAPSTLYAIDSMFDNTFFTWSVGTYTEQGVSRTLIVEGVSVVSSPNADGSNFLTAVSAVSTSDVWAVGYYIPSGQPNITRALILHRDGTQWSIVPANEGTNASRLDAVTAVAANDVWAVGRDESDHTLILHWDGSSWSRVPSPNVGTSRNILHGVSAVSSNNVWAAGYYGPAGTGRSLILHWDGSAWSVAPSPNVGDNTFPVEVDAYSENSVWVVGNYFGNGIPRTFAMRWDGSSWIVVSSPNPGLEGSYLNAVGAFSNNQVWAVGAYTSNDTTRTLIEQFGPASFSDVPTNNAFHPYIQCMVCRGIISGYQDGTFRPNNEVTRGQLSKIVSNSAGFNEAPGPQRFEDVPPGSTFYDWVNRLAGRGHISGYPCGGVGEPCGVRNLPYFRPNSNATRGQISKIVSNAAGYNETPTGQTFEDVPTSHPFYLWIERLASRSVMSGYPCGGPGEPCGPGNRPYFRPQNNATRGQTSKIVANTFFPGCETR